MEGEAAKPVILEQDVDLRSVIEMARRATDEIVQAIGQDALDAARNRSPGNVEKGKLKIDAAQLMRACKRSTGSLLADISSLTPHIPVMSEELKTVPLATRRHYQYMWYIEPMDGLQAALSTGSAGHISVCIALCHGTTPIIGVVHCLIENVTYFAIKGQGAYALHTKDLYDSSSNKIRRLKASTMPSTVVPPQGNAVTHRLFRQLEKQCAVKAILPRSHAIGMLHVAQGSAHVFLQLRALPEWTTAAPHIIVAEAGGEVFTYPLPGPLQYNKETLLHPPYVASARPSTQDLFNSNDQFPAIFTSLNCEISISRIIESACVAREKILQGMSYQSAMAAMCEDLASFSPHLPILSQDLARVPWEMRQNYKVHWIVDIAANRRRKPDGTDGDAFRLINSEPSENDTPMDGSRTAQSRAIISISLCREKRPISAVILDVNQGTVFFGEKGQGSYRACLKEDCRSLLRDQVINTTEMSLGGGKEKKTSLVDESTKVQITTNENPSGDVITFLRSKDSPSINIDDYMDILGRDSPTSVVKNHGGCGVLEWLDYTCYKFLKPEDTLQNFESSEVTPLPSVIIFGNDVTEWEISAMDLIISEAGSELLVCNPLHSSVAHKLGNTFEDDREDMQAGSCQNHPLSEPLYNSLALSFSACIICHADARANGHVERRHPDWTDQVEEWVAKSPRDSNGAQATSPKPVQELLNWIWPSSS